MHNQRGEVLHVVGLNKSFLATMETYGEGPARVIVDSWVAKMQWCLDVAELGGADFEFCPVVIQLFDEAAEVATAYDAGSHLCRQRLDQVRRPLPRRL